MNIKKQSKAYAKGWQIFNASFQIVQVSKKAKQKQNQIQHL